MFSTTTAPRCWSSWLELRSRACRISSQCVVCRKQGGVTGQQQAQSWQGNTLTWPGTSLHQLPCAGVPWPISPPPPTRGTDHLRDAVAEGGPHGGEHGQAPRSRPPQQLVVLSAVQHQQLQPVIARGLKEVLHLWPGKRSRPGRPGHSPAGARVLLRACPHDCPDPPSPPCSWPSYTCTPWLPGGSSRAPQTCSPRSWAQPSLSGSSACEAKSGRRGGVRAAVPIPPVTWTENVPGQCPKILLQQVKSAVLPAFRPSLQEILGLEELGALEATVVVVVR